MSFERYFYSSPDSGFHFKPRSKEKPKPLLTQEFALQLFEVTQHFAVDLPVASLVVYSDKDRELFGKEIAREYGKKVSEANNPKNNSELRDRALEAIPLLEQRSLRLANLPEAPISWRNLLDPEIYASETFTSTQKQVLIKALLTTLRYPNALYTHKWLDSTKTVGDLKTMDAREEHLEDPGSGVTRTMVFLSAAF